MHTMDSGRRAFLQKTGGLFAALAGAGAFAAEEQPKERGRKAEKDKKGKKDKKKAGWTPLFNGKDLTGWKPEGNATWTVADGCLVGTQGPNTAPGDLFTEQEYGDFELKVTYKIEWPANSGVWFRYQSPDSAYQADILEYKDPVAYSGTLYCPGKMFLAVNADPAIVKRDDWNTMIIKAKGDHLVITLNKVMTTDVHDGSFAKGRIGFQIHAGDEFKAMKISVREIAIRAY